LKLNRHRVISRRRAPASLEGRLRTVDQLRGVDVVG
jgi:hypothetical protein